MNKIVKYTLGIVSLIIILLLAIPFFISLETYKDLIASQVKKHTGRELKIEGPINLALLPRPQIKLTRLKLSSVPQAKNINFLEAESIAAKLSLAPLLKGKIMISSLDIINPTLNLEKLKNGKGTWEFDVPKAADNAAPASSTQAAGIPLIINDINIQNGSVQYIDHTKSFSLKNLDLKIAIANIYNQTKPTSHPSGAHTPAGGHWSHQRIDLSALAMVDGTIKLQAQKATYGSLILDNISLKSRLENGVLNIGSFAAGIYGGKLEGSGSLAGKGSQPLSLKLALKNAHINHIVPQGNKIKITEGVVDIESAIQSHGVSQADYVSNAQGSIHLKGRNGKVSGIDLHKVIQALNKPTDPSTLAYGMEEAVGKGETAFQSLICDISMNKGIMTMTQSELTSSQATATSQGKINLPQFTLDVLTTVNSGVQYLPPVTIHFYGSLDHPQHKVDIRAIWQHLVNKGITGVIDNIKQGKIKPKDLLKGLQEGLGGQKNTPSSSTGETEDKNEEGGDPVNQLLEKGLNGLFK